MEKELVEILKRIETKITIIMCVVNIMLGGAIGYYLSIILR
jgi:hypothetical protein